MSEQNIQLDSLLSNQNSSEKKPRASQTEPKKKRGRKKKIVEDVIEKPKRKRGRPAKDIPTKTSESKEKTSSTPKKRGRKPTNMKSYGVNQEPAKDKPKVKTEQKEEKIILHLPVKRQKLKNIENKMFRHETRVEQPMPMDYTGGGSDFVNSEIYHDIQNCPNAGTKEECYLLADSLVKCTDCRNTYNEDIDVNVDLESAETKRTDEYIKFVKNTETLPNSFKDEPIATETSVPDYDPQDIYYDSSELSDESEVEVGEVADNSESGQRKRIKRVIRPQSHLNPQIDEQAPSREQFEYLKQEYQHLRQKYKDLKNKYESFNQIVDISKEENKGVITDAPMHTTTVYTLMKSFRETETWPQRTHCFCWWDSHPFTSQPVAIPTSYNPVNKTFQVMGCFCSFQCALAYKKYDRNLDSVDTSLLYFFFNKITPSKVNVTNLKPAPPRQMLNIFGGSLSIDQYREFNKDRTLNYDMITYPLIPVAQYAEVQKKKDPEAIKMSQLTRPKLKLKRSKPLPHHKNTLENSMGLNVTNKVKNI